MRNSGLPCARSTQPRATSGCAVRYERASASASRVASGGSSQRSTAKSSGAAPKGIALAPRSCRRGAAAGARAPVGERSQAREHPRRRPVHVLDEQHDGTLRCRARDSGREDAQPALGPRRVVHRLVQRGVALRQCQEVGGERLVVRGHRARTRARVRGPARRSRRRTLPAGPQAGLRAAHGSRRGPARCRSRAPRRHGWRMTAPARVGARAPARAGSCPCRGPRAQATSYPSRSPRCHRARLRKRASSASRPSSGCPAAVSTRSDRSFHTGISLREAADRKRADGVDLDRRRRTRGRHRRRSRSRRAFASSFRRAARFTASPVTV